MGPVKPVSMQKIKKFIKTKIQQNRPISFLVYKDSELDDDVKKILTDETGEINFSSGSKEMKELILKIKSKESTKVKS